ncbi:MAG: cytochrome P450, partial [Gammaproteobacteria bacterium]|nr:cytochrome P450 [Gammaproteobacteria bacterium]
MDERSTPSLFDPATLVDPYPAYRTLRDTAPVYFEPSFGAWIVTRYGLVREALLDTATYSSEFGDFLSEAQKIAFRSAPPEVQQKLIALNKRMIPLPPTMLTLDEPGHTQYRSLVSQLFTGSQVKRGEPTVRRVIEAGIERLAAAPTTHGEVQADFVAEFALPVPLRIIADRLGIPERERAFFNEAAAAAADALRLTPLPPE